MKKLTKKIAKCIPIWQSIKTIHKISLLKMYDHPEVKKALAHFYGLWYRNRNMYKTTYIPEIKR